MRNPFLPSSILVAGIALAMAQPVLAAPMASLIRHTAIKDPWTITIVNGSTNFGKCKIFDELPRYDEDDELLPNPKPVAELKADGSSYTLERAKKEYWILIYPKLGLVNVKLKFTKANDAKDRKTELNVQEVNLVDKAVGTLDVVFDNNNPKATFIKSNYTMGRFQNKPLVTLD